MIRHILADGTELESIEGRTVPPTGKTEAVYRLAAGLIVSRSPNTAAVHKAGMCNVQAQELARKN